MSTTTKASTDDNPSTISVSHENLQECLDSSAYWVRLLPEYANDMQHKADRWAIAAGVVSAITSLGVWSTLSNMTTWWSQGIVAVASLIAGVCALIPRVKNYGEMAGHARELTARYGKTLGDLLDLREQDSQWATDRAHEAIAAFDSVKAAKDANLRDLPVKPAGMVHRSEDGLAVYPPDVYAMAKRGDSFPGRF
jgi:hypothetical protein